MNNCRLLPHALTLLQPEGFPLRARARCWAIDAGRARAPGSSCFRVSVPAFSDVHLRANGSADDVGQHSPQNARLRASEDRGERPGADRDAVSVGLGARAAVAVGRLGSAFAVNPLEGCALLTQTTSVDKYEDALELLTGWAPHIYLQRTAPHPTRRITDAAKSPHVPSGTCRKRILLGGAG